jgi:hypothetical protein
MYLGVKAVKEEDDVVCSAVLCSVFCARLLLVCSSYCRWCPEGVRVSRYCHIIRRYIQRHRLSPWMKTT